MSPEKTFMEEMREARDWVANLAWQRENNAVVCLDLRDCKMIRTVLDPHGTRARKENISRHEAKVLNYTEALGLGTDGQGIPENASDGQENAGEPGPEAQGR